MGWHDGAGAGWHTGIIIDQFSALRDKTNETIKYFEDFDFVHLPGRG